MLGGGALVLTYCCGGGCCCGCVAGSVGGVSLLWLSWLLPVWPVVVLVVGGGPPHVLGPRPGSVFAVVVPTASLSLSLSLLGLGTGQCPRASKPTHYIE